MLITRLALVLMLQFGVKLWIVRWLVSMLGMLLKSLLSHLVIM
jgi:hypothetical protein